MSKALDLATGDLYTGLFPPADSPTFTGVLTIADGSNDLNIASHDGTNGLKLGGTLITSTASQLNAASTHISLATAQSEANSASIAMSIALG